MPNFEPVVLEARAYSLRHIGPQSALFPNTNPPVALTAHAVLNVPAMVGRDLPMANAPNSQDFVSGQWVGRLLDAGEMQLTFPNKEASDGVPWRQRFSSDKKLQWIEIRNDGYLESVCCIEKVDLKRDQVVISGHDGLWQTKFAYERDWITVQAPRDAIERGTQVWMPYQADNFPANATIVAGNVSTPNGIWGVGTGSGGTVTAGASGGVVLSVPATSGAQAEISTGNSSNQVASKIWRTIVTMQTLTLSPASGDFFQVSATEGGTGDVYALILEGGFAILQLNASTVGLIQAPSATSYSLILESDGEWVWAFVNGAHVGCCRRAHTAVPTSLGVLLELFASPPVLAASVTITGALIEWLAPFLQGGSDKGDYVLPGSASAYPSGGLHARYYNDTDLQSDGQRLAKVLSPNRSQAYAGSGTAEYANQQDPTINHASSVTGFQPTPGAADAYFSVKWFGAIYLKLSAGNYTISFTVDDGVRIWIGKTKWGDQIIDSWISQAATTYSTTLTASSLAGNPSYGGTPVARDGWYPIVIEYFNGAGNSAAQFSFTPPVSYTDPGGTALTGGASVIVPASSLSPLGCVDQRHQGLSHFDLITKTAAAFGYQMALEPQSLESGLFPGVLAPRLMEGANYDTVLEPDDEARAEGLINYGALFDGTDEVTSLTGNGAGFQNGNTGQLQTSIYDPPSLLQALFDLQGWQDFSDASFLALLAALLNSQLGLRLTPWEILTGDPVGRPRLANLWPLPGALAQMRWRPGDGMRVLARDINIQDVTPRQLLMVTRQIHPNGATGTLVSFAARPRGHAHAIKQSISGLNRLSRNYQKQLVTLTGGYQNQTIQAGSTSGYSEIALSAGDLIVQATLRIAINSGNVSFNVFVNGADVTSTLNGPWTTTPITLNVTAVAAPESGSVSLGNRIYVALKNNGGVSSQIDYQLFVDVLR